MLIVILKTALSKSRLGTTCISLNDVKTSEEVVIQLDDQTLMQVLDDRVGSRDIWLRQIPCRP